MAPLRVLVVGEDALARAGIAQLVGGEAGLVVAGQAVPEDAPAVARDTDADVVVWDAGSDGIPDADALGEMGGPRAPAVVVLTAAEGGLPELLAAGVRGLLGRDVDSARLAAALHAVAQDLVVLDERLADGVLRRRPPRDTLVEALTPRETEVLNLLGQGLSNRAIAARLAISEHTAKFHVNAILGKLGAQTRAEAVAQGVRLGLLLL